MTRNASNRYRQGVAAVEFAIVVPVLIFGVLSALELARWYRVQLLLDNAIASMADIASRYPVTSVSATPIPQAAQEMCAAGTMAMVPFDVTALTVSFATVYNSSSSGMTVVGNGSLCGNGPPVDNPSARATATGVPVGQYAYVFRTDYATTAPTAILVTSPHRWTTHVIVRPRDDFAS